MFHDSDNCTSATHNAGSWDGDEHVVRHAVTIRGMIMIMSSHWLLNPLFTGPNRRVQTIITIKGRVHKSEFYIMILMLKPQPTAATASERISTFPLSSLISWSLAHAHMTNPKCQRCYFEHDSQKKSTKKHAQTRTLNFESQKPTILLNPAFPARGKAGAPHDNFKLTPPPSPPPHREASH